MLEATTNCPFSVDGQYDLIIGTSERGDVVEKDWTGLPKFKHMLLVFGGLQGLESIVQSSGSTLGTGLHKVSSSAGPPGSTPPVGACQQNISSLSCSSMFHRYINTCSHQTSRTIRTEEALIGTLSLLRPHIAARLGGWKCGVKCDNNSVGNGAQAVGGKWKKGNERHKGARPSVWNRGEKTDGSHKRKMHSDNKSRG
eukprot:GHVQ01012571.1.p1 GENE.GHVQ01012571.1~~GHVQ01012571.1.p1  ORF type:complete len:198 (+),score=22.86 GHVQ01012571.1:245-838(+)